MKVMNRQGIEVPFDKVRIINAVNKSFSATAGEVNDTVATMIANMVTEECSTLENKGLPITVEMIEESVLRTLVEQSYSNVALNYQGYRKVQQYRRESNSTDKDILGLVNKSNREVMDENSNKNPMLPSTTRDLIAGVVSEDISSRKLIPPHLLQAHRTKAIHFHDMDYFIHNMFNCCLVNIKDMLDNGTVINGTMIESPSGFSTACNIMTQIMAHVASSQYGGQSMDVKHLGKYLRKSLNKFKAMCDTITDKVQRDALVETLYRNELASGVQTIQYQINTLMTTNGQSPFVTLFLNVEEGFEYEKEVADIVEELLRQRIKGVKNEAGNWVTPTFPKLVYVLHEYNAFYGGKYDYITEIAVKANILRLYPDYISSKEMGRMYQGNVFSCMG